MDVLVPSGREVIERVTTSTGEWQLQRRDGQFEIICNGVFLMASYNRESDRQLAALALQRVTGEGLRVLVGGLGIGYTAQAALEDPRVHRVDVVELEPVVVRWHQTFFAELCGHPLDEPRTTLIQNDLFDVPLQSNTYDALLLDTDNGPRWLARDMNQRIYEPSTLQRFLSALRPGGVIAFWSADPAPMFAELLASLAGSVEAIECADEQAPGRATTAWVYLSRRSGSSPGPAGTSSRPGRGRRAGGTRRRGTSP
ncbi:MAG: spermine/spermidine synthase [Armatimonadetes bacterium]|nr:spermine/spermidine synthase [Armatimonadota bacterium]